jgi:hypothetical protein
MICTIYSSNGVVGRGGSPQGRDKVILTSPCSSGEFSISKLQNALKTHKAGSITAQKTESMDNIHHQNALSRLQTPTTISCGSRFAQVASKSRNHFLGIKGSRQVSKPKPSSPSKLTQRRGLGLAFLPSTSSRPLEAFLHTTLGGSVPQLLAASLHPLARMSTKAGYEEAKGVRLVGTKVLECFLFLGSFCGCVWVWAGR